MFLRRIPPLTARSSLVLLCAALGAACSSTKSNPASTSTGGGTEGTPAGAMPNTGTTPTPGATDQSPGTPAPGNTSNGPGTGNPGETSNEGSPVSNGTPLDNGTPTAMGGGQPSTGPATTDGTAPPPAAFTPDATKDCGQPANPQVPNLKLTQVVAGLTRPVFMTQPIGETDRLFVVEKVGRVQILRNGTLGAQPFLDVSANVTERFEELGFLGLAFHPKYSENGRFYVYYSTLRNNTVFNRVVEYKVSSTNPDQADPTTERVLLELQKPQDNHNGGNLNFGPDGFLYFGTGDGGSSGDPHGPIGNAQNLSSLLGKMLRIDVDGTGAGPNAAYGIPVGNIKQDGAQPEIWSYGLRNPWRYSFDPCTGDMYIGDVGQDKIEEVDYEPFNTPGRNYGWRLMEADSCYNPTTGCSAQTQNITLPVASYTHAALGQSITGGYVYRGSAIPDLRGTYLYADYETKRVFALRMQGGEVAMPQTEITQNINADGNVQGIGSFAQDNAGNLYAIEFGVTASMTPGRIFRIDPR
jgi:glucose/arabinose dehydrogenase